MLQLMHYWCSTHAAHIHFCKGYFRYSNSAIARRLNAKQVHGSISSVCYQWLLHLKKWLTLNSSHIMYYRPALLKCLARTTTYINVLYRRVTDQSDHSVEVEYFSIFQPNILPLVLGMLVVCVPRVWILLETKVI